MRTLYIGLTNPKDTEYYYTLDKSAFNLDNKNYEKGLQEKKSGIFYTSLSDFKNDVELLYKVCLLFDRVIYNPPSEWKNQTTYDLNRIQTESLLLMLNTVIQIHGINNILNLDLSHPTVERETQTPQLWVAGCGYSSAEGVQNNERWGQIVADRLNLPVSFLAETRSGNSYQVDQVLSSDIRKGDIILFQVTNISKDIIVYKNKIIHVTSNTYKHSPEVVKDFPLERLTGEQENILRLAQQKRDFKKLNNFCTKVGVKLLVWGFDVYPSILLNYLLNQEYYFHFTNAKSSTKFMLDYGTDEIFPGPLQHQAYAKFVLEKLKLLEEQ